jgi:hypothetical protein
MQDRSPRIRRIGLAIKSEDFSRRIAPPVKSDIGGKTIGSEPADLGALLPLASPEGTAIARVNGTTPTELR